MTSCRHCGWGPIFEPLCSNCILAGVSSVERADIPAEAIADAVIEAHREEGGAE